ncbi:VOC family protein [Paenibacillus sp. GCM10027629]|uniref:VOC family protein n=1 Tax=Paenibacillus sp. GCM10027629 TaxID=3273414 RepID=UPI00363F8D5A
MSTQVNPFILLDGTAKEAIQFYEQALGAKVLFQQPFGDAPEGTLPADAKARIAHSVLSIDEAVFFVSDSIPGDSLVTGNHVGICLSTSDASTSQQFFEALQQGGKVEMPLQEIYFSPAYGVVTDKFGVTFQIFTKRPR